MRLFGIETEYGITREDLPEMDPVVESMELVRAHLSVGTLFAQELSATDAAGASRQGWDYKGEDPHQDARGFRVASLQQDKEEDAFAAMDAHRPFSFHEMKSDLVLPNGARFYNDHTHPEYSTPECRTLRDLIAQDRAGERIVQRAADRRNRTLCESGSGEPVQVYKNNTDFHGHSYGCHDNYLMSRALPFADLASRLLPFLVSRQIIAGAGKVGIEGPGGRYQPGPLQLSQRADFMETDLSVDTMHNRPIVNTRDEPHADRTRYRRLHLIVGDANMCEYATALKVGTTRVVLDLIERGLAPDMDLEDPVAAIKTISWDIDLKAVVSRKTGGTISGLEIQQAYCDQAAKVLIGTDEETDWVIKEWADVLTLLSGNREKLCGRLDWVTKQWLLNTFIQEEHLAWDDPWLASLDLEYHNLNSDRGLFLGLEAEGKTMRLVTENDIQAALSAGPADTRAGIRGLCIRRFGNDIASVQWERMTFKHGFFEFPVVLEMGDLFEPDRVRSLAAIVEQAVTPSEALKTWEQSKEKKL